jgi:hypothetical protein
MLVGVWSWIIWPRFGLAIWDDPRAWSSRHVGHGSPTGFLWIHAFLIIASLVIGTVVGVLGIRIWRGSRTSAALGPQSGATGPAEPASTSVLVDSPREP